MSEAFTSVLIANRGEIAVRIIRACQQLGLEAVAVYSDADAESLHVELADKAVHIGASEARASYLDVQKIIEAAQVAGAQAIHPGYGFLAENADFARRCVAAGLVFIGPGAAVIQSMGAKIEAKRIAEAAGVACVPGYHGDDQSETTLAKEAERIGTPLLIKASAGGGGRGMRRVDDLAEFGNELSLAREEAKAAFGDPAVLLERYVEAPRHIEVQVLADQHGNVRHLFERDCSVQRNYQKVIEEAPAPNLEPGLRARILESAVKLSTEIGYDNAGTVEFLVDARRGEAYFLEMNTRLQVEHPVTEMVTGIDLVEWQLRIARGETLGFTQEEITCNGWAIEARVAAEDPAAGYQPQTGTVTAYNEPQTKNLRIDSGIRRGSVVSPYYDSMLAKVIAWGGDRETARGALRAGLARLQIGGVKVNTGFLHDVLDLEAFRNGQHLTSCLQSAYPEGWSAPESSTADTALVVLARHVRDESSVRDSAWSALGGWRLGEYCGRRGAAIYYVPGDDGSALEFAVTGRGGDYVVEHAGDLLLEVRRAVWAGGELRYQAQAVRQRQTISMDGRRVTLHRSGGNLAFDVLLAEQALLEEDTAAAASSNDVSAPTPGLVTEVLVSVGQTVATGDPVIVMEAMKLLQQLCAPVAGVIGSINYQSGDTVNSGDCLISIDVDEEA